MKITLSAVGNKMPAWVESGVTEYLRRLPADFTVSVKEVSMSRRGKNVDIGKCVEKESLALLEQASKDDHLVALDVRGAVLDTISLAGRIKKIRGQGKNISLLIGGPDGLSAELLQTVDERWSLSALTLPHPLVRVLMAEQLYRVWSLLNNHPYHRE